MVPQAVYSYHRPRGGLFSFPLQMKLEAFKALGQKSEMTLEAGGLLQVPGQPIE